MERKGEMLSFLHQHIVELGPHMNYALRNRKLKETSKFQRKFDGIVFF